MHHQAHTLSLSGRFRPLSLPPSTTAPPATAAALERYRDLTSELKAASTHGKALAEKSAKRAADEKDARAAADGKRATHSAKLEDDREAARLAIAGIEVKLDRALDDINAALVDDRDTWTKHLANKDGDLDAKIADGLAVVAEQIRRKTEVERLAAWLANFPQSVKWAGTLQPIPAELSTPLSTLQRYTQGSIPIEQLGLRPPLNAA